MDITRQLRTVRTIVPVVSLGGSIQGTTGSPRPRRLTWLFLVLTMSACGDAERPLALVDVPTTDWKHYGGDLSGSRYSPLAQINRSNVHRLSVAWSVQTGDFAGVEVPAGSMVRFQATPLAWEGSLYLSTPRGRVLALHPRSGEVQWAFDPGIEGHHAYPGGLTSRGVARWADPEPPADQPCSRRIFLASIDARLFALDARTGTVCTSFGEGGAAALDPSMADAGRLSVTSPPLVVGNTVVVGSALDKSSRTPAPAGTVRAYHARTGEVLWTFDPLRVDAEASSDRERPHQGGGGNVWSIMVADPDRDMVFLPTASAAPDHYGVGRPGRNVFANAVVALRASTGEFLWGWQAVQHDLWDYDIAAQPLLIDFDEDLGSTPAIVIGTKTGMVFVLHRETGEPLLPIEHRAVPPSDVPGEAAWPTQPFSMSPPPLLGTELSLDSLFGLNEEDRGHCQETMRRLRNEGIFTPPSEQGTLLWPGAWGGINWGGLAWDPENGILITSLMRLAMIVQLHPRVAAPLVPEAPGEQILQNEGTPYAVTRRPFIAPSGVPCSPPPWSMLVAIDLPDGVVRWTMPLGHIPSLSGIAGSEGWGSLSFGGPLVTAGGIVFVGGSQDDHIRAFDLATGEVLWEHALPAGGQATPMSFGYGGRQYVVIAAGGRSGIGSPGDWVVAFALPS